ncbi:P63C domain-containing protein [Comamonas sp.]|uniref:P63C domain-containing protein n=1 Tax=Comamonas sp. TaxID=34028 RepID=UPI00289D4C97|nr:P63C domain-containing protein [Comamonas sp.]
MTSSTPKKAAGGFARAAKLTPEQRKEQASAAARAKGELKKLPLATHGSDDHPLVLGDKNIQCYVLEDGTRVLSDRSLTAALGITRGSTVTGDSRVVSFAAQPFIVEHSKTDVVESLRNPIKFRRRDAGRVTYGYPATILADICDAVLAARASGQLTTTSQLSIAAQCEILVRGFARVGIIALVDEVTGYEKDRAKDSLAKILEAFVAKELQAYVKTFPTDFYEQLFRLRGLRFPPDNPKFRPQYFGMLTNDIVYERLAPGLLEELKRQAAKDERKAHLHRRLTAEVGHPKLREHLASVVTAMKLSRDYPDFIAKLNTLHPRFGTTLPLDLDEDDR